MRTIVEIRSLTDDFEASKRIVLLKAEQALDDCLITIARAVHMLRKHGDPYEQDQETAMLANALIRRGWQVAAEAQPSVIVELNTGTSSAKYGDQDRLMVTVVIDWTNKLNAEGLKELVELANELRDERLGADLLRQHRISDPTSHLQPFDIETLTPEVPS